MPPREPLRRSLRFQRAAADLESRILPLSVSSDTGAVERYIQGFGYVREILSHEPGSVDVSRFEGDLGGPLLYNHDFSRLIGRFRTRSFEGGKWRGEARFGNSPEAESAWRDVQDDVLVDVSITYDYDPQDVEVVERDGSGKPTACRVKRWTPYEVSMVTVPADASVGKGRMAQQPTGMSGETQNPKPEERHMPPKDPETPVAPAAPAINLEEIRAQASKDALSRVSEILALADTFHVTPEKRQEWLGQGASVEQVRRELLEGFRAGVKPIATSEAIGMTDAERQRYSLGRAALALESRRHNEAGFEREVSDALVKKLGRSTGGFLIPSDITFRAANSRGANTHYTGGAGGELVFKEYAGFIDMLRNDTVVLRMGARMISGLQGTPTWVKQTGTTQIYWVGENPGTDVADSKMAFALVNASPKTVKAMASYTRQQLAQGIEAIDQLLQDDLVKNHALGMDSAALMGSGSSFQPTGLLNTAGVVPFAFGVNGAVPTYEQIVDMETLLAENNAIQVGEPRYLTTPGIRGRLKKTPELGNTANVPVWRNGELNGYSAEASNQMPGNLTKGTSNGVCHAMVHGIFGELFILEWGVLEMMADPYTLMGQDIVRVSTSHILDVFVRRPASFVIGKDALKA